MINKVLNLIIILFLISTSATAQMKHDIEIFDINKGEVIENVQSNPELQQEVKRILKGITGIYVKNNPIPNKGFMIKVLIEPHVMVKNQWFNDLVDEVIVIFPVQENPYLLIFEDENRPYFFTFAGDTAELLSLLNFKP